MKKLFVESSEFTAWITRNKKTWDRILAELQIELMEDPDAGVVIPGCGGLRKIRTGDPVRGKGKRGGVRIIYLNVPETNWVYLLDVYDKNEKDDLSADEKRLLTRLIAKLKTEAIEAVKRRTKGKKTP